MLQLIYLWSILFIRPSEQFLMNQYAQKRANQIEDGGVVVVNGTTNILNHQFLNTFQPKTIAGASDELSNIAEHPYLVSVQIKEEGHICAGTIISPHWILTAADCVVDSFGHVPFPTTFFISYGSSYSNIKSFHDEIAVRKIEVYPVFEKGRMKFDIAMLYISTPIVYSTSASPINIATRDTLENRHPYNAFQAVFCKSCGWGDRSEGEMYESTFVLNQMRTCEVEKPIDEEDMENTTICTKPTPSEVCNLDIGSPLICNDIQVGILSGLSGGCRRTSRLWTRIDVLDDWVKTTIIQKNIGDEKSQYSNPLNFIQKKAQKSFAPSSHYHKSHFYIIYYPIFIFCLCNIF